MRRLSKTAAEEGGYSCSGNSTGQKTQRVINMLPELKKLLESVNEPQIQAAPEFDDVLEWQGESMKDWFEAFGDKIYTISVLWMDVRRDALHGEMV